MSVPAVADTAVGSASVDGATWPWRYYLALIVVCLVGLGLVARGLTDEGAVSLDGDMPHYLMNGVFVHDLIRDAPVRSPLEYARRYYARYPAITLGHHPFVPALAELPFFAVFGVSVFSARLATMCTLAVLLVFWFKLLAERYDTRTALLGSLLLLSTSGIIPLFQVVLSEPYALCLIVLSVYFLERYRASERRSDAAAFAVCVVLSAYAKHLAVIMFPVYVFQFVGAFGVRRLFRRSTVATVAAIGICLIPLLALTLKYSQWNVLLVTQIVKPGHRTAARNLLRFAQWLWQGQFRLSAPVLALATVGTIGAAIRRDRRILLFVAWAASVYIGLTLVAVTNDRFFCYWLPAFCALAAAAVQLDSSSRWRTGCTFVVIATVIYQFWAGAADAAQPMIGAIRPAGATGYEEAARYVSENRVGDTILYSAEVDTGYFVFFVRKADPNHDMVVLRADKTLTTSRIVSDYRRLINAPSEITPILKRNGVGYVVTEDRPYPDGPLLWLQQLVRTNDFELRRRIPIESTDLRLINTTLSIYEYKGRVSAAPDATLSIGVPMMNGVIQVPLADLVRRPRGD